MLKLKILLIALILLPMTSSWAMQLNRKVLVLWDKTENDNFEYTFSLPHQKLEVIFNHYGMKFDYLDVGEPFDVSKINFNEYRGVLVWLTDITVQDPEKVLAVLTKFNDHKKKIGFLGQLGFQTNYQGKALPLNKLTNFFKRFDLDFQGGYWGSVIGLEFDKKTPATTIEFERALNNERSPIVEIRPTSNKVKSWLDLKRTGTNQSSSAIMAHELFFWAQGGYEIFTHPLEKYTQWRLNPFILAKWFWGEAPPLFPDTNTINGKRIYYSHIDGDGIINMGRADRKSMCGEIIEKEIISKYEYPITVSFIGAEIKEITKNQKRTKEMVQNLTSHPWVKWASHSYTHPLTWAKVPSKFDRDSYIDVIKNYKGGPIVAYQLPNYKVIDYDFEINKSYELIKEMIPDNKQSEKIILWTGNCRPPEEAIKLSNKFYFANINGGDSRFDQRFPSYSTLWPLYRKINNSVQPYSSNSNENTYTHNWTGPFHGFREVIGTFKNTETPHRIKPINIYFHFYSGERKSSLNAIKEAFEWAFQQDINPIFIYDYASIVNSFEKLTIEKSGENRYLINNGKLKELRLESNKLTVDLKASKNVIGLKESGDFYYVHLGPSETSEIQLVNRKQIFEGLFDSNSTISEFKTTGNTLAYSGLSLSPVHTITIYNKKKISRNSDVESTTQLSGGLTKINFKTKGVSTTLEFIN